MPSNDALKNKRITLATVASESKVSLATASAVLNGKSNKIRISSETKERVMAAARALDYTPNLLVKGIQSGKTNVISFFNAFRVRTIGDLYMDRLSASLEVAAGQAGYDLLMHCDFSRTPEETYRYLNGGQADAVIMFAPIAEDPLLPYLRASKLPVVLVNSSDPEGHLPSVRDDLGTAMRTLARTFYELGHRRIMPLVEHDMVGTDARERVDALKAALAEFDIDLLDEAVVSGSATPLLNELPALLKGPDRPTALFCWRDYLAYQVLEAGNRLGIRFPEEVSLTGYDGLHWPAATPHEAASTHIDLHQLAQQSVHMIDTLIQQRKLTSSQVTVRTDLRLGTTLGIAPRD